MEPELEKRLRELIDRQDIWNLLLRYGRGLDRLDNEMLRACYWDDAIDDHHSFVGTPDEFVTWTNAFASVTKIQHHGLGNHYCEISGDNAHSETYYTYVDERIDKPHLFSIGRYVDHFQRRNGVWKIANRVTVIEKLYQLQDHPDDPNSTAGDTSYGALLPTSRSREDLSYLRPLRPRKPRGI